MKRYQELVDGDITMQDLTDTELVQLRKGWDYALPPLKIWIAAQDEQGRREVERASKPLKAIDRGFYS